MRRTRLWKIWSLVVAGLLLGFGSSGAHASRFEVVGDYVIHYNALNTTILSPKMAENYNITRSKNRALLTIAVRKKAAEGEMLDRAVSATVSAGMVNLSEQYSPIEMREIREPAAIYYIGVFPISKAETLGFTLKVTPEGKGEPHEFKFRQEFFTD